MSRAVLEYKISHCLASNKQLDQEVFNEIFTILPQGTQICSIEELPITSLFVGFKITLSHDLFKEGAEILLKYRRNVGFDEDGRVLEYNMVEGFNHDEVIRQFKDLEG